MFKQVLIATALVAASQAVAAENHTSVVAADAEMVTITKTDFRGRPPFKRTRTQVPVSDLAVLEPQTTGEMVMVSKVDRRGRPPFRRYDAMVPVAELEAAAASSDPAPSIRRKAGHGPFGRR